MAYDIGLRIRNFREARKMTQKQLARLIGVTNSRVSNWEQGLNRPDVDLLADICRALSVSPSELLDFNLLSEELTCKERRVVQAYRDKTHLQGAIDILLGIDE